MEPVIIVHGGAGRIQSILHDKSQKDDYWKELHPITVTGYDCLCNGGDAMDAVEVAIQILEDSPKYNAGYGSVLTTAGQVEMDAMVMRGDNLAVGAVGCVTNVKNVISLARLVMEKTSHVLLVGPSATQLARDNGLAMVSNDELISDKIRKKLDERLNKDVSQPSCDTVGAVAMDRQGNIAVGNSTGGIMWKLPGRVGDSACVGSGAYADNTIGGVALTGQGELITRTCMAHRMITLMQSGIPAQEALDSSLAYMKERVDGYGGAICITKDGDAVKSFTTEHMSWASIKGGVLRYGIEPGEEFEEKLSS